MKTARSKFLTRWFVGSFGLWIAVELLGEASVSYGNRLSAVVISGLFLAIANTFIKPLVVFLTLPAVLLTLGIFIVFINAFIVSLVARVYGPLEVESFGIAVIVGLIIGLVNWLVTALLEDKS